MAKRVRACLVILVAAVMLLISTAGTTGKAPATADALGCQDVLEAESSPEEEETSDEDAAHLQATGAPATPSAGARRPHAFLGDAYDDGHRRRLFRPPNA